MNEEKFLKLDDKQKYEAYDNLRRFTREVVDDGLKQDKEIERLHSIIKEAKNKTNDIEFRIAGKDFNYYFKLKEMAQGKELLEILDKVEENTNGKD